MSLLRTLSAVSLAALVCLAPVLVPAGTVGSDAEKVTVSLVIVETTPEALAHSEDALGFSLDPTRGRCVLTTEEQATLATAIMDSERSNVLARATVVCLPEREAALNVVETVRVPARYDAVMTPDAAGKLRLRATDYTTREIGLDFRSTLLNVPSKDLVTMSHAISLSRVSGWREITRDINEPVIKTWDLATTTRIPLGKALVLINRPYQPFEPPAEAPDTDPRPRPQPVVLIVIGVE